MVRRCDEKIKEADKKKSDAEKMIANTKAEIDIAAEKKIAQYKLELKKQSKEKVKHYAVEYDRRYMKYKTAMIALLVYSLIATFMEIVTTDACIRHFDMFASNIVVFIDSFAYTFEEVFSPLEASGIGAVMLEAFGRMLEALVALGVFVFGIIAAPYYAGKFYYKTVLKNEREFLRNGGIIIAELSFILLIWICKYFPSEMKISVVWMWILIQLSVAGAIKIYQCERELR